MSVICDVNLQLMLSLDRWSSGIDREEFDLEKKSVSQKLENESNR